jgi:hypothetical protein
MFSQAFIFVYLKRKENKQKLANRSRCNMKKNEKEAGMLEDTCMESIFTD